MFNHTLFLPYDVYSRHKIISELLGEPARVLDVGGSLKQLSSFISPSSKLFTTDIVGGDVIYNGQQLPFKDKCVDSVVSIDTIEHIPQNKRLPFLAELIRVAKKSVILAAPMGTPTHSQAEKEALNKLKKQNKPVDQFLLEHVQFGLPTLIEIKIWLSKLPHHQLFFSGNWHIAKTLWQMQNSEIPLPKINRLWFEIKKILNCLTNLILFPLEKYTPFSSKVNRFYLVINITK